MGVIRFDLGNNRVCLARRLAQTFHGNRIGSPKMKMHTVIITIIALVVGAYVGVKVPTVSGWIAKLPG